MKSVHKQLVLGEDFDCSARATILLLFVKLGS